MPCGALTLEGSSPPSSLATLLLASTVIVDTVKFAAQYIRKMKTALKYIDEHEQKSASSHANLNIGSRRCCLGRNGRALPAGHCKQQQAATNFPVISACQAHLPCGANHRPLPRRSTGRLLLSKLG